MKEQRRAAVQKASVYALRLSAALRSRVPSSEIEDITVRDEKALDLAQDWAFDKAEEASADHVLEIGEISMGHADTVLQQREQSRQERTRGRTR
jgi:hypothetical protein